MRKVALLAVACVALVCVTAQAQQNSVVNLLDSPVKHDGGVYNAGETITCSVALPASAALFGTDTIGATNTYITDELFAPFRVFQTDSACNLLSSWSTAFTTGGTMTGIAVPNGNTSVYWAVDPFAFTAFQFNLPGGTANGTSVALPAGSLLGAAVVDNNQGGEVMCIDDIATDTYSCINANTGAFMCSYANADNTGSGAFGNGMGDAVSTADCSGATLVQATGTINELQVTRVGQYDCVTFDPACTDRWDVAFISTFVNGIEEDTIGGARSLVVADNVTATWLVVQQPIGINDCQDIDANMDVVYVNGGQGTQAGGYNVNVSASSTLAVADQKTTAGNGKFVHHMNAGTPNAGTVSKLFDLGNQCFPFVGGAPAVVENNVGKTNLVGASNYFAAPIADPAKAPTFLASLTQVVIDTTNLPAGSSWTHQAIHLNGAASSKKGGSLSNAVVMTMQ